MREAYFVSNVKLTNLHKYVIIKVELFAEIKQIISVFLCENKDNNLHNWKK